MRLELMHAVQSMHLSTPACCVHWSARSLLHTQSPFGDVNTPRVIAMCPGVPFSTVCLAEASVSERQDIFVS